jgi:hypothetical protein
MSNNPTTHRRLRGLAAALALMLLSAAPVLAQKGKSHPGYVDCSALLELVGEDDIRIEIHLPGSLIRAMGKVDPDLYEMIKDVQSMDALIVSVEGAAAVTAAKKKLREMASKLREAGWDRIALIKEGDDEVQVLVLSADENFDGLVVLVIGDDEGLDGTEVICTNIAGTIDMEAIRALGEEFEIPGLDQVEGD